MARLGRYFVKDQALHVTQRGNNKQKIFFEADDYAMYHGWLADAADGYGCKIHAYVLMPNHVHFLLTPENKESLPRMMQSLGRRYVRYVNDKEGRSGTLWEGRYRAAPIDSDAYFLSCCKYIERNPVRAKLVEHPRDYPWSSYRAHATGAADEAVGGHKLFRRLGRNAAEQQKEYRALVRGKEDEEFLEALRAATNGGWALGGERFRRDIAKAAKRRATALPKGRRPKPAKGKKRG